MSSPSFVCFMPEEEENADENEVKKRFIAYKKMNMIKINIIKHFKFKKKIVF